MSDRVLIQTLQFTKKGAVYVRKNKQTNDTSANVISNKENVINVNVANASKEKTMLCVSCMQNVLIPCHDKCLANYKLNVHSNVRRAFTTNSRTPKSLDTTSVVSKPKIDIGRISKVKHKVVQIVVSIVESGCSISNEFNHRLAIIYRAKSLIVMYIIEDMLRGEILERRDLHTGRNANLNVYYSPFLIWLASSPFVSYNPPSDEEIESSTAALEPSNVQNFHQVQPSTHIWTKDQPLDQVIGDLSKPVMTRQKLQTDSEVCMYALTVSTIEPKNIKEAMAYHSWIESMQDEV
ncbi:hypothetical protein Tco_1575088 [Tanacetum coccineum]